MKNNREKTFIVHGEAEVKLGTFADSFKDGACLNTLVAEVLVDVISREIRGSKRLVVPLFTFVSLIIFTNLFCIYLLIIYLLLSRYKSNI